MAKIIITMTRRDISTPWFIPTNDQFTEDELNSIVIPYRTMMESAPGFINRSIEYLDDLRQQQIFLYETLENAQSAIWEITGNITGHIGATYRSLVQKKRNDLGINIIISNVIEE